MPETIFILEFKLYLVSIMTTLIRLLSSKFGYNQISDVN